jgi:hypothetical protein
MHPHELIKVGLGVCASLAMLACAAIYFVKHPGERLSVDYTQQSIEQDWWCCGIGLTGKCDDAPIPNPIFANVF